MESITNEHHSHPVADTCRFISMALVIAFFLPLLIGGFGVNKLVFINIAGLGKGSFMNTINLLYPLIAGIMVYLAGQKIVTLARPIILLVTGLLPFLLSSMAGISRGNMFSFSTNNEIMTFIILTVIGVYSGSKLLSQYNHISSRLLGGLSGIIFIMLMLLPITSKKPPFFSLFELFKSKGLAGSQTLLGFTLVVVFSCFIWAAFLAIINLRTTDNHEVSAKKATKFIYFASLALPVGFLISGFSSILGFFPTLFLVTKFSLGLGGLFVLITIGLIDLVEQLQPKTMLGGKLLEQINTRD